MIKARRVHKELMKGCKKPFFMFIYDYTIGNKDAVLTPKKRKAFISKNILASVYMTGNPYVTYITYYKLYRKGYPIEWCMKGKTEMNRRFRLLMEG